MWGAVGEDKFLYDDTYASPHIKSYSVVFGADNLTAYDEPFSATDPHAFSNALNRFSVQTYGESADSFIGFKAHGYNSGEEYYNNSEIKIKNNTLDFNALGIAKYYHDLGQLYQGKK